MLPLPTPPPPDFEGINSGWIGIAAVVSDTSKPEASIVVIYDKVGDGSGGEAKVDIGCVSGDCTPIDTSLIAVYDDNIPAEKISGTSINHVWAPCCTDGFSTIPLGEGTEICLIFTGLIGLNNGIRFYFSSDGTSTTSTTSTTTTTTTTTTTLIGKKSGEDVEVCLTISPDTDGDGVGDHCDTSGPCINNAGWSGGDNGCNSFFPYCAYAYGAEIPAWMPGTRCTK
jgi:hypothetical protein